MDSAESVSDARRAADVAETPSERAWSVSAERRSPNGSKGSAVKPVSICMGEKPVARCILRM